MKRDLCPICGSYKTQELYPANVELKKLSFTYVKTRDSGKTFRSVKCLNCTHVFCSPLPKNIYKNYEDVIDSKYLRYTVSIRDSSYKILPLIKKIKHSGKILDVGCATGEFLEVARNFGYSIEGLELSKWSTEIARKKGIKVYNSLLKSLASKYSERYEVITLFGVIEHFENPKEEMKYIKKLLKSGGILVVWTGDVNSISSRILGRNWWYWQGQHIQYFTNKSLNLLAEEWGLEYLFTKTYPFVARYDLVRNSLSRYSLGYILTYFLKPIFLVKPKWTLYLPGEMLWFAVKPS